MKKKEVKKSAVKKSTTKKMVADQVVAQAEYIGDVSKKYAINESYRGLRELGHAPMVVAAMINELSAGFNLADIQDAAVAYGDI